MPSQNAQFASPFRPLIGWGAVVAIGLLGFLTRGSLGAPDSFAAPTRWEASPSVQAPGTESLIFTPPPLAVPTPPEFAGPLATEPPLGWDESPRTHGCTIFYGYEAYRGVADGGWMNNGMHTCLNYGTRLGAFSEATGIGLQLGGSIGVYDWSGTDYHLANQDEATPQGMLTGGFFRKATIDSPWSFAIVQDWMVTANYSVFAENPTLGQWRGQIGYAYSDAYEFGLWGTAPANDDTRNVPFFGDVTWRAVTQVSFYWHAKWDGRGPDTWLWVGVPEHNRLAGEGSLGDYLAGALFQCPLTDRLATYGLVTYMHPSTSPGPHGGRDEAWNFAMGLTFYPGRNARVPGVHGDRWMPALPIANNGTFLVDASQNY